MPVTRPEVGVDDNYRDWVPPMDVRWVVSRLLDGTASRYKIGLSRVVLTNASGLSHDRRRQKTRSRGRKVVLAEARGAYHQQWQGDEAWVEIFVDNTLSGIPPGLLRLPPLRDSILAEVLFHEIGHHLHATQSPEYREPEGVAERWRRRLWRQYAWRRYWYLLPWFYPIHLCVKAWKKVGKLHEAKRASRREAGDV